MHYNNNINKIIHTSFSPDKTSNNARSFVPSLRSSIKSSTLSGGTRWKIKVGQVSEEKQKALILQC